MSSGVTKGIYDELIGEATITDKLSTYQGNPAVFSGRPIPGSAEYKYLMISGPTAGSPWSTKQTKGKGPIVFEVMCFDLKDGSSKDVKDLAWAVHDHFAEAEQDITIPNHNVIQSDVTGPTEGPTDSDEEMNFVVTLSLTIEEV